MTNKKSISALDRFHLSKVHGTKTYLLVMTGLQLMTDHSTVGGWVGGVGGGGGGGGGVHGLQMVMLSFQNFNVVVYKVVSRVKFCLSLQLHKDISSNWTS